MSRRLLFSVTLKDCRVETFRGPGPGGQHKNKVASAVRITHLASGAVGQSTRHRSQGQNKREAFLTMANSKAFKAWNMMEAARRLGQKSTAERVAEAMAPENLKEEWRCQFCEKLSLAKNWKDDRCPECGNKYDALLAQEGDD